MVREPDDARVSVVLVGILWVASLACIAVPTLNSGRELIVRTESIGFDFTQGAIDGPQGDLGAPNHIFIHKYPMPSDGLVTSVILLNDTDEVPEIVTLLILRPVREGWEIVHSVPLPDDDIPATTSGISVLELASPLAVQQGDIFAHWQPESRPTGPIPQNVEEASLDGQSIGKFGFNSRDIEVGQIVSENGFTGRRDYAVNLVFKPADPD